MTLVPVLGSTLGKIFAPLFEAVAWILAFFYALVPNYVFAIGMLTLTIMVLTAPLTVKSTRSMAAMQKLQPQMKKLQQKYKGDKVTLNEEMMKLYRENHVNPAGGCLPMLLQYPLLIGFYEMLEVTIALRHAHWLWLPDLSAPDPYHVLPIFVIVSMFLVQFFTPSPGVDQKQQRMMAFMMPAFFGFLMWNIGSGVALYWAGGNVIGVLQQWIMNRSSMGREMKELATKRAAKKAGKKVSKSGKGGR